MFVFKTIFAILFGVSFGMLLNIGLIALFNVALHMTWWEILIIIVLYASLLYYTFVLMTSMVSISCYVSPSVEISTWVVVISSVATKCYLWYRIWTDVPDMVPYNYFVRVLFTLFGLHLLGVDIKSAFALKEQIENDIRKIKGHRPRRKFIEE